MKKMILSHANDKGALVCYLLTGKYISSKLWFIQNFNDLANLCT